MPDIFYAEIVKAMKNNAKLLAVLVDPEKFNTKKTTGFLDKLPKETTHLFVGGSTATKDETEIAVIALKQHSNLPIILFPGNYQQITQQADALLFLSLHSGRNPEYLIGQQVKAASVLNKIELEVIPTSYLLIDGGHFSAVARVSDTMAMCQNDVDSIVNTALAGQFMGAKLVYLEAGSGAKIPVSNEMITKVKSTLCIPVIVGGGIRTVAQREQAYLAGADLVVMGTVYENDED